MLTTDRPRAAAARPGQRSVRRWGVACCAALLLAFAAVAEPSFAAVPTSRDVRGWLTDLSSRLPSRREAAHRQLMSLSRPGLDLLRDAIKEHARELSVDEDLLHDIVIQAFLATEEYPVQNVDGRVPGFLGVQFDNDQLNEDSPYDGVEIRHIIPGLCASKYLEEGDVVLDVTVEKEQRPIRSAGEMMMTIGSLTAGQQMNITLIRRGRTLSIDMTLGGRPPNIQEAMTQFEAERQTDAEAYWDDHFAALFNPTAAPTTAPPARASAR